MARNRPYAGGHILRTHGRPEQDVHAVQIEIDRRLYLAADRRPDRGGLAAMTRWFAALVEAVAQAGPGGDLLPLAAE